MKKIIIKHGAATVPVQSQQTAWQQYAPAPKYEENGGLCFFLGALFGPFGILLSAIIGRAYGLKKSLVGFFLLGIPLTALIWWLTVGASRQKAVEESKREAARVSCIANMKQIALASESLILLGKEPVPSNIYGPDKYIKETLVCPLGGSYSIKKSGKTVDVVCPHADKGHVLSL